VHASCYNKGKLAKKLTNCCDSPNLPKFFPSKVFTVQYIFLISIVSGKNKPFTHLKMAYLFLRTKWLILQIFLLTMTITHHTIFNVKLKDLKILKPL